MNGGGFNLGFRTRREAIDMRDQVHSYILAMDTFARALRNAARLMHDGLFKKSMNQVCKQTINIYNRFGIFISFLLVNTIL